MTIQIAGISYVFKPRKGVYRSLGNLYVVGKVYEKRDYLSHISLLLVYIFIFVFESRSIHYYRLNSSNTKLRPSSFTCWRDDSIFFWIELVFNVQINEIGLYDANLKDIETISRGYFFCSIDWYGRKFQMCELYCFIGLLMRYMMLLRAQLHICVEHVYQFMM